MISSFKDYYIPGVDLTEDLCQKCSIFQSVSCTVFGDTPWSIIPFITLEKWKDDGSKANDVRFHGFQMLHLYKQGL